MWSAKGQRSKEMNPEDGRSWLHLMTPVLDEEMRLFRSHRLSSIYGVVKKNIGYFPRNHKFSFCVGFPCHVNFLYLLGTCNLDELNRLVFCLLSVCRHLCMRLFSLSIYALFLHLFSFSSRIRLTHVESYKISALE